MKLDAKTIAALATLVAALAGGVELRVQVGLLSQRVLDLDNKMSRIERVLEGEYHASNP